MLLANCLPVMFVEAPFAEKPGPEKGLRKYIGDVLDIRKKVITDVRRRGGLRKRYCIKQFVVA